MDLSKITSNIVIQITQEPDLSKITSGNKLYKKFFKDLSIGDLVIISSNIISSQNYFKQYITRITNLTTYKEILIEYYDIERFLNELQEFKLIE